ncbi:GEVED domain-containing protein [Flavobacterium sp.]|uniref:GEVED domain-containing protein n=1 Tax=Flavobacterium sp. TaxID=239 RepID=UPI00286D1372|nr:GEVED domain-containing protein [Flavobacterium sp.]
MKTITSTFKKTYLTLGLLLMSFVGLSQSPFTDSSNNGTETFTVPTGVTSVTVQIWGGGGGGGGSTTSGSGGSGGGGGGYTTKTFSVTAGENITYTIGTGGIAGTSGGVIGGTGVTTTLNHIPSTTILTGTGGTGGNFNKGTVGSGGSGSGGTTTAGSPGIIGTTSGGNGGNGGNATLTGGTGSLNAIGGAGVVPGGGGGGGEDSGGGSGDKAGGAGANGRVIITYSCPSYSVNAGADQSVCTTTATLAGTAVPSGTTGIWTLVSGTATITTPSSPTSGITGISVSATLRWTISNGQCGTTTDDVIITKNSLPTATITPSPATAATGVCYGGSVPVTSVSWASTATATSYDVYFGSGSLPGTVTSNVTTNSYSTGTLLASTTYYWKVVAKNACGDATGSSTWTFTTASSPCVVYCTPTASSGVEGTAITNVSYSTVNYTTSNTTVYNNYTAQIGDVVQGAIMPISVTTSTGKRTYNIKIWVDWNDDGDFTDSGEEMFSGSVYSTAINGTINVPLTATVGSHRMRVGITQGQGNSNSNNYEVATPCFTGVHGAFEDYTINVTAASVCTLAPTVSTSPASVTIANNANTSFTATFANTPTSYLWEVSSDGGTNYTPITNGGVYTTATTATLTLTAANYGMNGFKYRVSASNACGTSSVSVVATLTITAPSYCTPTTPASTYWITSVASQGNLNDTSYSGSPLYSTSGYANYSATTLATQTPGGGMNFSIVLGSSVPPGTTKADRSRFTCFVDWNGDGDFTDSGETVYTTGIYGVLETTFGFEVPQAQGLGNYRMRIRNRRDNLTVIDPCTTGSSYPTGEVEDYTIAVVQDCASKIQSVTDSSACGNNTVTLGAVGIGGATEYRWYTASTGGSTVATTTTGSWTTPALTATQIYYVTSFNGSCESLVRTRVVATIVPTTVINFTPTNPTTCGEDNIITINAAGDTTVLDLFVEDFEGSTVGLTATMTATSPGADSSWSVKTNTCTPSTIIWKPAINSGSVGSKFALTSSDYAGAIITSQYSTTTSVNSTDFINLTLSFKHYFSYYEGVTNSGKVQVSTNGGTSWTTVQTYISDLGLASRFTDVTVDLTAYINQTNLKLRFEYYGDWSDGWAIDDIRFYGTKQLNTTFTWNSSVPVAAYTNLGCTTPYTNQTVSTIYLKPDLSQLETSTFPITVNATLGNGCPVSQIITVTNNSKVWRGNISGMNDTTSEWNDPDNWKPYGIPTSANCVIAPENTIISGTNYDAYAKNIVVKNGGTFVVQAGNNITVSEWIKVETGGLFTVKNNASILQTNDDANIGIVNIERTTKPMNYYDYTYWNSPVTSASNFTLGSLSPGSTYIYSWTPSISNGKGNWQSVLSTASIVPTKGYIVRAPNTFSTSDKVTHTGTFSGTPNNGSISTPISKGTFVGTVGVDAEDDEWNLIGNPYPSGINATTFLNLPANAAVIEGTIYIWTHNTVPTTTAPDPFYGDYVLNYTENDYAVFNTTGGTATAPASSGGSEPTGFIASGQSFFVKAADGMTNGTTANVTFNNSMRASGKNSDFFKTTDKKGPTKGAKHRIWLNLANSSGAFSQTLVGYLAGATEGLDRNFDGASFGGNDVTLYSIIPQSNLTIQGRSLPFVDTDIVNIGFNASKAGSYSIRIDHVDGIFNKQNVYLEDKLLNVIFDLKKKPYDFTTAKGTFNSRFVIRYSNTSKTLGTEDFNLSSTINVITKDKVRVQSSNQIIKKISVFDLLGRNIDTYTDINSNEFTLNRITKTSSALLVKITLENDAVVSKKIIF